MSVMETLVVGEVLRVILWPFLFFWWLVRLIVFMSFWPIDKLVTQDAYQARCLPKIYYPTHWNLLDPDNWELCYDPELYFFRGERWKPLKSWISEVRLILMDYFRYPGPYVPPEAARKNCSLCGNLAKFWCESCKTRQCANCCARCHHPYTWAETHNVEQIPESSQDTQVCHFISPILDEIVLAWFIFYCSRHISLPPHYLAMVDMCPVVDVTRDVLASFDAKIIYYGKESLSRYCGIEDSFYKLFMDGWVRNIVSDTDDTLLLMSTVLHAVLFQAVARHVIVPVFAVPIALLKSIAHPIELEISCLFNESYPQTWHIMRKWLNGITGAVDKLGIFPERGDVPPQTIWRIRPGVDRLDDCRYRVSRLTRWFRYYFECSASDLKHLVHTVSCYAVFFRIVCIWSRKATGFRLGAFIRHVLTWTGFANVINLHQDQFGTQAQTLVNDSVIIDQVWPLLGISKGVMQQLPLSMKVGTIVVLVLAFILPWCLILVLLRQRRDFSRRWADHVRVESRGSCGNAVFGSCDGKVCKCCSIEFFANRVATHGKEQKDQDGHQRPITNFFLEITSFLKRMAGQKEKQH